MLVYGNAGQSEMTNTVWMYLISQIKSSQTLKHCCNPLPAKYGSNAISSVLKDKGCSLHVDLNHNDKTKSEPPHHIETYLRLMKNPLARSHKCGQTWLLTVHWILTLTTCFNAHLSYRSAKIHGLVSQRIWPLRIRGVYVCVCVWKKNIKNNNNNHCWLLMAPGAMRDGAMEQLSNVLSRHENEAERNESVLLSSRSIVPHWFYYEVENSLIISLLKSCVS